MNFVFCKQKVIMSKKVDYLIALINEFGKLYGLSDRNAYLYFKP